ncbi:MAG: hypothetical protein AB1394_09385 [Bacteroidota bacterium]
MVDGTFCSIPSFGCYTLDEKDLEIESVKPDIYVKTTFKDRLENMSCSSTAPLKKL